MEKKKARREGEVKKRHCRARKIRREYVKGQDRECVTSSFKVIYTPSATYVCMWRPQTARKIAMVQEAGRTLD